MKSSQLRTNASGEASSEVPQAAEPSTGLGIVLCKKISVVHRHYIGCPSEIIVAYSMKRTRNHVILILNKTN